MESVVGDDELGNRRRNKQYAVTGRDSQGRETRCAAGDSSTQVAVTQDAVAAAYRNAVGVGVGTLPQGGYGVGHENSL